MSGIPAGPIDHVAIAVRDLDVACAAYVDLLGAVPAHREKVTGQRVEVLFLELPGATRLELVAPLGDDSPVTRFLQKRGEGLHHICVEVEDIDGILGELAGQGVPLVDRVARPGSEGSRIAFLRPEALGGVLLELKERRQR